MTCICIYQQIIFDNFCDGGDDDEDDDDNDDDGDGDDDGKQGS